MMRIGDFSKLSRVSIKTLRYYDEMGLLIPWMFSKTVLISNFIIVIDIFIVSMLYFI